MPRRRKAGCVPICFLGQGGEFIKVGKRKRVQVIAELRGKANQHVRRNVIN